MLEEDRLALCAVFGLGDEVGGARLCVGRLVGDHDHLARARGQVDPDTARDEQLCGGDVGVPRADDAVDGAMEAVPYARAAIACAPPTA